MQAAVCRQGNRHNTPHRTDSGRGAGIIDVGAYSSRPNAENVSPAEEMERLLYGAGYSKKGAADAVVSVDTFRADVARMCVEEYGVAIINDIAAGEMDGDMFRTVADLMFLIS